MTVSPGRVLLVDDEPNLRLLLEIELADRGFHVVGCGDPREAIAVLGEQAEFDVLLTDIRMPGLSGLELTRWVKEHRPEIEVILMTGYGTSETAVEGLRLGAADYLLKPFDTELMVAAIRRTLEAGRLRKEAEALRQQLVHSDRLAALGQLAASVAHEINNPAGYVLGNVCLLKESMDGIGALVQGIRAVAAAEADPARRERLSRLLVEADADATLEDITEMLDACMTGMERVSAIVKDLRVFARADLDQVEMVSLHSAVATAVNIARVETRRRARLETDLQPVPAIAGHSGRLAQVVLNLVINAAHAIEEGEPDKNTIRVSVRPVPAEGDAEHVLIEVSDTGRGMAEEERERVFDPFFTTKAGGQGTGLGLSLAEQIVHQHGGRIRVESTVGRGTRFEVRLPLDTGLSVTPVTSPDQLGTQAPRKLDQRPDCPRVLVVDDEPMLLKTYRAILKKRFEVTCCADGAEAIALLWDDPDFDAIVCDLMMPELDGMAVYRRLADIDPALQGRCLFTTGGATTPEARAFALEQESRILNKPCTADQLLTAVELVLEGTW